MAAWLGCHYTEGSSESCRPELPLTLGINAFTWCRDKRPNSSKSQPRSVNTDPNCLPNIHPQGYLAEQARTTPVTSYGEALLSILGTSGTVRQVTYIWSQADAQITLSS